MAENSVELVGLAEARRDLVRWADQLAPAIQERTVPFADRLAERVRGSVPVLTGMLASSVEVVPELTEHGSRISLGAGVPYAGWIEFGGSRGRPLMPEGRYLYPAAVGAEDEFARLAEQTAEDTVRRFPW